MADTKKYSPQKFIESCRKFDLTVIDTNYVVYTEFENGFWLGVARKQFASLDFPPNELIIGFSKDVYEAWEVDEVVPLEQRELFLSFLWDLEKGAE